MTVIKHAMEVPCEDVRGSHIKEMYMQSNLRTRLNFKVKHLLKCALFKFCKTGLKHSTLLSMGKLNEKQTKASTI